MTHGNKTAPPEYLVRVIAWADTDTRFLVDKKQLPDFPDIPEFVPDIQKQQKEKYGIQSPARKMNFHFFIGLFTTTGVLLEPVLTFTNSMKDLTVAGTCITLLQFEVDNWNITNVSLPNFPSLYLNQKCYCVDLPALVPHSL